MIIPRDRKKVRTVSCAAAACPTVRGSAVLLIASTGLRAAAATLLASALCSSRSLAAAYPALPVSNTSCLNGVRQVLRDEVPVEWSENNELAGNRWVLTKIYKGYKKCK